MTSQHRDLNFWALAVSLALHAALLLWLPRLDFTPDPPPFRLEVAFSQLARPQPPAPPTPEEPEPPQPHPVVRPRPVLRKVAHQPLPVLATEHESYIVAQESPLAPADPAPAVSDPLPSEGEAQAQPAAAEARPSEVQGASTPSATPSDVSTETDPDEAWDGYGRLVHEMVSKHKQYPAIAIRRHWEGRVQVSARMSMGKLVEVTLRDSSGYRVLDEQALAMVRKAIMAIPVSGNLLQKSFTVVVPVDFRLI